MSSFTHLDEYGRPQMVDVGGKGPSVRKAWAEARICLTDVIVKALLEGGVPKGEPFTVAELAGIMGAKQTPYLIPLCHPIKIDGVSVRCTLDEEAKEVIVTGVVSASDVTGVEMEALMSVSVAALAFYDMCKALDKGMEIRSIRLLRKTGGKSGDWTSPSVPQERLGDLK
ncbi:molybdenum cofactor biosynthesis protein MoaC [Thermanaerovibrio velox DSM 12556]|uniref:Cyclic pyranopterin monophosphate synthase n=1 Tax=Thermanaerovibrio velox DSM 12556 TaxID=926567 RepID=H0URS3_9BACT|nr:cyclic pyranopterin monophosphate synthase MoaC [Thermanaerovibrio velox]EHM10012.1 molybdenum cofactor biosynthesis protein MoaC [Thermanaerovibrio velox DSM 12556]